MNQLDQKRRTQKASSEAGFSLLEVVIAILTITLFLLGTLQLMAVNALYKVRSERQSRADFWIQEDMEDVKSIASTLNNPNTFCPNTSNGYAIALRNELGRTAAAANTTSQTVGSRTLVGKNYTLFREFPDDANAQRSRPHRLRIDYRVALASGQIANDYQNQETTISTASFEVIPNASFQCP
jgi:Tfp pilus assembly protein PilV